MSPGGWGGGGEMREGGVGGGMEGEGEGGAKLEDRGNEEKRLWN